MNILSIQSHVSYGHVGNAAAAFPLQRLGFTVWPVHTVLFSNHTGYPDWAGAVTPPDVVADIIGGMERRGAFERTDAILTGYVGDPALGAVIADAVRRIRDRNASLVYCCDPVMGDTDRGLYVRPGIPEFMQGEAVPLADILTPNQFEVEQLTGITVNGLDDALKAARALIAAGPSLVLMTSLALPDTPPGTVEMLLATAGQAWRIGTPRVSFDITPNGSGDAVAALFLGHYLRMRDPLKALEAATAAIFSLMETSRREGGRELALVAAQDLYASPQRAFRAIPVG